MASPSDFALTTHAIDRRVQRGGKCAAHIKKLHDLNERRVEAYKMLVGAKESKAFTNNTLFMTSIHTKYEFDKKFVAFLSQGLIFLGIDSDNRKVIVTVLPKGEHYVPHLRLS